MSITVIPVGILRNYVTAPSPIARTAAEGTIDELVKQLAIPSELVAMVLVNGVLQPKSYQLAPGDVVRLLPLMGGG